MLVFHKEVNCSPQGAQNFARVNQQMKVNEERTCNRNASSKLNVLVTRQRITYTRAGQPI